VARIAFFSPLPPARSGIADYAEALLEPLRRLAEVDVFTEMPGSDFAPERYDALLYQMGNNGYHVFTYEMALRHPGIVVMHESNLHHLLTELTIRRDDWDAYVREAEHDGGPAARAFAERVRALEVGPDYEGVPMLRRLMAASRGAIAHSEFVAADLRAAGLQAPVAVIPHGAWIPPTPDRMGARHKLGLDAGTPLIGIFGFLKPYKRIAESLRAFKRLLRVRPDARMILVGEPHPELQLDLLLDTLQVRHAVRVLGFTPIEDFTNLIAACDIILNLRFPTVGESSGTLLRSLGLGRAVLVSDIGSFREYPDEICLKVPVGAGEEDLIFEYLNLLVSRPDLASAMGARAQEWVARECPWDRVAERYLDFLLGRASSDAAPAPAPATLPEAVTGEYIQSWVADPGAKQYLSHHTTRFEKTLELTPPGDASQRILEMGAYMQITPALQTRLGYGEVRGCYYGPAGKVDHHEVTSETGETFACDVDLFDAEHDVFPYPDAHFDTVLCCELVEHLKEDPMHMMAEINRVLKPGGHLVLTTPNIASLRALSAILQGYHPGFFPAYIKPSPDGVTDARHAREYTPKEAHMLLHYAGFEVTHLETGPFRDEPKPEHAWVETMLRQYGMPQDLRGDGLYIVGRKRGPVVERFPAWLYS
jgi:glycosyltransferase involved in cell wall biosynthesis/SAM-dependent methyltransferase